MVGGVVGGVDASVSVVTATPVPCQPGYSSLLGSAQSASDCSQLSGSLPGLGFGIPSSNLTWATTACLTFEFEEELIVTTLANLFPGANFSDFPLLTARVCNGQFDAIVQSEFLLGIPCLCRSTAIPWLGNAVGDGAISSMRQVVPKTMACGSGYRLSSGGKPVPGQTIADNACSMPSLMP